MAFDEQGQAETVERKVAICGRAYDLLTERGRLRARGHRSSTRTSSPSRPGSRSTTSSRADFIEALPLIKERCPGSLTSGGVSNLSFSFRGNDVVREAMHAAFLYHAIHAGLDMGIVNAGQLAVYQDIPADLLEHVEDVILARRPDATERLVALRRHGHAAAATERERRPRLARGAGGRAALARARARHRRLHRGRHRGGAARRAAGRSR